MSREKQYHIPYMKYYKSSEKLLKAKAIFPNHTFIYTGMNIIELHKAIKMVTKSMRLTVTELGYKEKYFGEPIDAGHL